MQNESAFQKITFNLFVNKLKCLCCLSTSESRWSNPSSTCEWLNSSKKENFKALLSLWQENWIGNQLWVQVGWVYNQLLLKIDSWVNQKVFFAAWYSLSMANQKATFKKVAIPSSAKLQELKLRNVAPVVLLRFVFFQEDQEMEGNRMEDTRK